MSRNQRPLKGHIVNRPTDAFLCAHCGTTVAAVHGWRVILATSGQVRDGKALQWVEQAIDGRVGERPPGHPEKP